MVRQAFSATSAGHEDASDKNMWPGRRNTTEGMNTWSALGGTMDHPFKLLVRRDQVKKSQLTVWAGGLEKSIRLWKVGKVELLEVIGCARVPKAS